MIDFESRSVHTLEAPRSTGAGWRPQRPSVPQRVLVLADARDSYQRGVIRGVLARSDTSSWSDETSFGVGSLWRITVASGDDLGTAQHWDGFDGVICALDHSRSTAAFDATRRPAINVSLSGIASGRLSIVPDAESVAMAAAEHLLSAGLVAFAWCGEGKSPYGSLFAGSLRAGGHAGRLHCIDATASEATLSAWLLALPKPAGLLTGDDRIARCLLEISRGIGVNVPEDLAIVGIGNDPVLCEPSLPQLSSVALPGEQVGAKAANLLARLMTGAPTSRPRPVPSPGVVVRRSSDLIATGDPRIDEALRFIGSHATGPIGVPDVLAVVGGSRRTLEARFRRLLQRSPAEEIRRVRLTVTKRLLAQTELPIGVIAERCGFSGLKHLCETFSREEGISAGRYRRRFRNWQSEAAE